MKRLIYFFIYTFLFHNLSITAQQLCDFETWNSLGIQKKLFDKSLTLSLSEEIRFKDNSSTMDQFFTEFGIKYKFLDHWSIGTGYRIIRENEGKERNAEEENGC